MLALAYFHSEQYGLAVDAYEKALVFDPNNRDWKEMLHQAKGNYISEVNVAIPDVYYFDREKLLMKPVVPEGALPPDPSPAPPPGLLKKIRVFFGNGLGVISTAIMDFVTWVWGR